jgi:hypothetical protein
LGADQPSQRATDEGDEDEHRDRPPRSLEPALPLRLGVDDLGGRLLDLGSPLEDGGLKGLLEFEALELVLGVREDTLGDCAGDPAEDAYPGLRCAAILCYMRPLFPRRDPPPARRSSA